MKRSTFLASIASLFSFLGFKKKPDKGVWIFYDDRPTKAMSSQITKGNSYFFSEMLEDQPLQEGEYGYTRVWKNGIREKYWVTHMTEEIYVDEKMILDLGFKSTQKDKEWPYTMIFEKANYTIQYINPWGQGNMDEGWLLKKDGVQVSFTGYRNTLSGKLPNAYILFKHQLNELF